MIKDFAINKFHEHKNRVKNFSLVGISSVVVQTVAFNVLIVAFSMDRTLAVFVSDIFAIISSFFLNDKITFKEHKSSGFFDGFIKFTKYSVVVLISTFLQAVVVKIGTGIFGTSLFFSNFFFMAGLGVAMVWNYCMHNIFTWRKNT